MSEFSYPIRKIPSTTPWRSKYEYVYKCQMCGKEVGRYTQKRVRGRVWCHDCNVEISKRRCEKTKRLNIARAFSQRLQFDDFGTVSLDKMYGQTRDAGFELCFEIVMERMEKIIAEVEKENIYELDSRIQTK